MEIAVAPLAAESFIARQPVFDRNCDVVGYELLFRSGPENYFSEQDGDRATSKVMLSATSMYGLDALTAGRKAFVNVTRNVLLNELYTILPPHRTVIEILEDTAVDDEVVLACETLREAGYQLAVDDFAFGAETERLLPLADIVKIDFNVADSGQRRAYARLTETRTAILLAEKIETYPDLREAVDLGYTYFQGFFYCTPQVVRRRDLPTAKLNSLRLLEETSRPMLNVNRLDAIIRQDVGLSYKLLKYLNIAAFGLPNRIRSIKHAITMLGDRAMRKWASLIVLAGLSEEKPPELFRTSLIRARLCELLAQEARLGEREADCFMVGLFSMLDAILDREMAAVLEDLQIPAEVKDTLLGEPTTLSAVRRVAIALERGRWEDLAVLHPRLTVNDERLPELYRISIRWAEAILCQVPEAARRSA